MKKFLNLIICFVISITLVSGCSGQNNQNKYGEFVKTGNNIIKRSSHTATLLPNGNVLIAGGIDYSRHGRGYRGSDTAEIYNQKTGKFSLTGKMIEKRINPQSILLPNGKILIVDGVFDSEVTKYKTKSAELYDYKTGKFTRTGDLNYERLSGHTLTLLKDGRVLLVGGLTKSQKKPIPCEIYDYKTGKFRVISAMNYYNRSDHTATLLNDGKVLITGGSYGISDIEFPNAEIFDPKTEKFTKTGKPMFKRQYAAAILLNDGNVLIIGGKGYSPNNIKIFPKNGKERFIVTPQNVNTPNSYDVVSKSTILFLEPLDLNNAEIYNPKINKFEKFIYLNRKRERPKVIKLFDGRVLIDGGADYTNVDKGFYTTNQGQEELYNPNTNKFDIVKSVEYLREDHTATLLKNGDVLVVGGCSFSRSNLNNLIFKYKGE